MKADEIDVAVETIFRQTGIEHKPGITLEDFQYVMLKEDRESFEHAQLSLPGKLKQSQKFSLSSKSLSIDFMLKVSQSLCAAK